MEKEFKIGSMKVKINKYRSTTYVNTKEDMTRLTLAGTNHELRPIVDVLDKIAYLGNKWPDPNRNNKRTKWYKLYVSSGEIIKRAMNNEFDYEEWVDGSPGTDLNYIKVARFTEFDDDNGSKDYVRILMNGNLTLSADSADLIGIAFIGEAYDPDFVYEYDPDSYFGG